MKHRDRENYYFRDQGRPRRQENQDLHMPRTSSILVSVQWIKFIKYIKLAKSQCTIVIPKGITPKK